MNEFLSTLLAALLLPLRSSTMTTKRFDAIELRDDDRVVERAAVR